jgi:hypothetical protein
MQPITFLVATQQALSHVQRQGGGGDCFHAGWFFKSVSIFSCLVQSDRTLVPSKHNYVIPPAHRKKCQCERLLNYKQIHLGETRNLMSSAKWNNDEAQKGYYSASLSANDQMMTTQ